MWLGGKNFGANKNNQPELNYMEKKKILYL